MTPQYVFGPGVGWITPLTDYAGTTIAAPTPILVSALQDISLDFSAEVKELYGSNAYALAIGRGKQKVSLKIKNGQAHGRLWNSFFFGQYANLTTGIFTDVFNLVGLAIPSTPYQITVSSSAGSATNIQIPSSGTFGYDLGVRDVNNLPYARVASGAAAGQYSQATDVYTFAAADVGNIVYISYNYTASSTGDMQPQQLLIQNPVMGYAPTFQFDMIIPYNGNVFTATLYNCMASKVGIATKLDDFAYPEFDFSAFAPGSANVGKLSWSQ